MRYVRVQVPKMSQCTIPVIVGGYECPSCGNTFGSDRAVCDHHRDVHGERISTDRVKTSVKQVTQEPLLESLYNLNKHAKKYAGLAEKNYKEGKGATAKTNSVKKEALYSLKSDILERLYKTESVDEVEQHLIDEKKYWLFRIDSWTYHVPVCAVEVAQSDISKGADEPVSLDGFSKSAEKERSSRSLKSSLLHIQDVLGMSANDYLSQPKVSYGRRKYFTGWKYL